MTTDAETFDCLKFKEEAQEAIQEATAGMTPEQEIAWFDTRVKEGPFKELVRRLEEAKRKKSGKEAA